MITQYFFECTSAGQHVLQRRQGDSQAAAGNNPINIAEQE